MFDNLSKRLLSIFDRLKTKGILTEEAINSTLREIRISLLEADVALPVVKQFISNMKEKLNGQQLIKNVSPEQTIIKLVYDELVALLNSENQQLHPGAILLVGLHGVGKTTTAAKIAKKLNNKCLLVPLDTYRPAAIDQLRQLAKQNNIDFFNDFTINDTPINIATKAHDITQNYEYVIYDTAGRLYADDELMQELQEIKNIVSPSEILLVLDSMMGQEALNTAKTFNSRLSITGLIFTRIDGDAKGGAILSAKMTTNCPIKFLCTGERIQDIELFHADRIASRILDKGDIVSLVEDAMQLEIDKNITFPEHFDLIQFQSYLSQINKLGGLTKIIGFMPGGKKIKEKIKDLNISNNIIKRQIAIIQSMTVKERKNPKILDASRKKRIAAGSGQEVQDVNKLLQQYTQIKSIMSNGLIKKMFKC